MTALKPSSAYANEIDGRKRRAAANRNRIVEALIALVRQGRFDPTAEEVAQRAGVGLRTVFRHFKDMESLRAEIATILRDRLLPMAAEPLTATHWRDRIDEIVRRRARMFEELMLFKMAADGHRNSSAFLMTQHAMIVKVQRAAFLAVLPEDRARDALLVEALDLALSVETWRRLRMDQKLSPEKAQQMVQYLVDTLLGPNRNAAP